MTANKNLVNHLLSAVIVEYSKQENISLREAMSVFYKSDLYKLIVNGVSDMHCRSCGYLAEELRLEIIEKAEEEKQIAEKCQSSDTEFFMTIFVKEMYRTLLTLPEHIKKQPGQRCTPFDFLKVAAKSPATSFVGISTGLVRCIDKLIELDISFNEIAEKINADSGDLKAFYENYVSKTYK